MARSLEARIRELERAASKAVHAAKTVSAIADLVLKASGYPPPESDADPEPTVTPKGPRPLPPSTAPRPVSLTHLPDGRAILEVGDARIDFAEREIEVLTWMLAPKVPKAPVSDWRT